MQYTKLRYPARHALAIALEKTVAPDVIISVRLSKNRFEGYPYYTPERNIRVKFNENRLKGSENM